MAKIKLFISYSQADSFVVQPIFKTLGDDLHDDLDVFIDKDGIRAGQIIEKRLVQELQETDWFIMIYPTVWNAPKDMSWCYKEAGIFEASALTRFGDAATASGRSVYLYDGAIPRTMQAQKGILVQRPHGSPLPEPADGNDEPSPHYDETAVAAWLGDLLSTKRADGSTLADINNEKFKGRIRKAARAIISAFERQNPEEQVDDVPLQPRISFKIAKGPLTAIDPDTVITGGGDNSLERIFGLTKKEARWAEIKDVCRTKSRADPIWLRDIEKIVADISRDQKIEQTEALHVLNGRTFFRPFVPRFERFRNETKRCHILFAETHEKSFNSNEDISALIAALILTIRFRQRVIPLIPSLKKTGPALAEAVLAIEREITYIENEAVEFGLMTDTSSDERSSVEKMFEGRPNGEFVQEQSDRWRVDRRRLIDFAQRARGPAIENAEDVSGEMTKILTDFVEVNARFIEVLSSELAARAGKVRPTVPESLAAS
jgi:hypothetical protein